MIYHIDLDIKTLVRKIRYGEILFGGNKKLKIYGKLDCTSGKRMKKGTRVFFLSEQEALNSGYRPCGHCMQIEYNKWKTSVSH